MLGSRRPGLSAHLALAFPALGIVGLAWLAARGSTGRGEVDPAGAGHEARAAEEASARAARAGARAGGRAAGHEATWPPAAPPAHPHATAGAGLEAEGGPASHETCGLPGAADALPLVLQLSAETRGLPDLERIGRARSEERPAALDVLLGAIRASEPAVVAALVAMALEDASPERRSRATLLLGAAAAPDERIVPALEEIASRGQDLADRLVAVGSLAAYARVDPVAATALETSAVALIRTAPEPALRAQAVCALDLGRAADATVRAVADLLATDGDRDVRAAAVQALGSAAPAHRGAVLEHLERAHARETDASARARIVEQIVRVGRDRALPVLARLDEADPDLAREVADLAAILAGDEVDLDRIYALRARQAPAGERP